MQYRQRMRCLYIILLPPAYGHPFYIEGELYLLLFTFYLINFTNLINQHR